MKKKGKYLQVKKVKIELHEKLYIFLTQPFKSTIIMILIVIIIIVMIIIMMIMMILIILFTQGSLISLGPCNYYPCDYKVPIYIWVDRERQMQMNILPEDVSAKLRFEPSIYGLRIK